MTFRSCGSEFFLELTMGRRIQFPIEMSMPLDPDRPHLGNQRSINDGVSVLEPVPASCHDV